MSIIKGTAAGVPTLSEAELMCRMIEAWTGEPRPEGFTTMQAISGMIDAETRQFFASVARAAFGYIAEHQQIAAADGGIALH